MTAAVFLVVLIAANFVSCKNILDEILGKQEIIYFMSSKKILELKTPDLGDSEKIELVKWYVRKGESVQSGQEILELVTDKAAFPMESPYDGTLEEILIPEGSTVQRHQVLGILSHL